MKSVRRNLEIGVVGVFVLVHLAAPFVVGELYPFTVSPMFSDQPSEYSVYEVFAPDGRPIDSEPFGLHLVYDGNPVGLGMGIQASPTMHGFGEVPSLAEIEAHVQARLATMPELDRVTVRRHHVSCQDHKIIEAVTEIEVERPSIDDEE